jgi:hypothetical protein
MVRCVGAGSPGSADDCGASARYISRPGGARNEAGLAAISRERLRGGGEVERGAVALRDGWR